MIWGLKMGSFVNWEPKSVPIFPFASWGGRCSPPAEVLEHLPDMPEMPVVLAKPKISVSTAWAYQNYDAHGAQQHPDNVAIQKAIASGDGKTVAKLLCNVLESVTIKKYEVISKYKQMMMEHGALASMMSGSGPTVFALAESEERAKDIAAFMRQATDAEVFVTKTVGRAQ